MDIFFGGQLHWCLLNACSLKKVLLHFAHLYFEQVSTWFVYVHSPETQTRQWGHV